MADPARMLALARQILPAGIGIGTADPWEEYPPEPGGPARATPARLREFAAGRRAVRRAMAAADMPEQAVPMGPDRAPVWPQGVSGSITHSAVACLAIVASSRKFNVLGIDLEPDRPLPADLAQVICLPQELAWLDAQTADARGPLATLIFSAKESAYKAQYPLTNQLLGFDTLRIDLRGNCFTATFLQPVGRFAAQDTLCGRWARGEGHFATAIAAQIPGTGAS